jgi:hypothetical protein
MSLYIDSPDDGSVRVEMFPYGIHGNVTLIYILVKYV